MTRITRSSRVSSASYHIQASTPSGAHQTVKRVMMLRRSVR